MDVLVRGSIAVEVAITTGIAAVAMYMSATVPLKAKTPALSYAQLHLVT